MTDNSHIFLGKKVPEILLSPLLSYTKAKSLKYVLFRLPKAITQIRRNENNWCIFLYYGLSQSYHLAVVSARNMLVPEARESSTISCQNYENFEPPLLACLPR